LQEVVERHYVAGGRTILAASSIDRRPLRRLMLNHCSMMPATTGGKRRLSYGEQNISNELHNLSGIGICFPNIGQ
jgi:hypothetical protein